uniref:PDZ domain-containing protein n=1 Tax=Bos mutus grunniens TaxID=30521 RepID=A0A8B9WRS2_BOSMU
IDSFKVVLEGPALWGFWPQVGKDFTVPFSISWLTHVDGENASSSMAVGDWVLSIDGENAGGLIHMEAQNKIHACGESLSLGLSRAQSLRGNSRRPWPSPWTPLPLPPLPRQYTLHPVLSSTIHLAFRATPLADSALNQGKTMSWSCRAHATPTSRTGTPGTLPMCSTCNGSLALAGWLPPLPLFLFFHLGHLPLALPASAYLTHPFVAPALSLLLA